MRTGINFNLTDDSASHSRPDANQLMKDSRASGSGDSILDDLFSDDDNSSHVHLDTSEKEDSNSSYRSNSLVDNDYNPLLDDDDSDDTIETADRRSITGSESFTASDSLRKDQQDNLQRLHQSHSNQSSGSHVSRHSLRPDSVSRETMQTDGAAPRRAPLRRPDAQQVENSSVKTGVEKRSLSSHSEPERSFISPEPSSETSSSTPQPVHRRRIGIPSPAHSQELSERTRTNRGEFQPGEGDSQADQNDADNSPDKTDSDSISHARRAENKSGNDSRTPDSLSRRPVTPPARRSVSRPPESHSIDTSSTQASDNIVPDKSVDSVSRETSSTNSASSTRGQHTDRSGSHDYAGAVPSESEPAQSENSQSVNNPADGGSGSEVSPSVQSSTTNTGSSSGHYWVGSNTPDRRSKGSQDRNKDSKDVNEEGSGSDTHPSDPAPRKRGRGRPRNFLNTILPENRGNDFAERRWQGARKTKDFAPHVGFPVRTKEEEAELRRRQRAGETIPGRKKRDPKKKYHRKTITEKDILVFELARTIL